ncbi:sensor histidine kinase [Cryptosporangium aurantiacum]|uniref:Sensor-like histidine kinase SenX3 n=1 Tax=Cryptosporangium aurantiacum TaxID=134849 RepID=A0A1M7JFA2_9ACTN|nr:PAS domain-containing sensor histidine kinase [Cryptosporangium aurantiacum]SHM51780.1 Signal transduction histidine kinase [Cryptosporangium aurantiacum]
MTSPTDEQSGMHRRAGGERTRGTLLAATVAVLGVALSVLLAEGLRDVERHGVDRAMDRQSTLARTAVAAEIRRYTDTARQLAASLGALETLDESRFAAVVPDATLAGAAGLSVVVPATTAQVSAVQRAWRADLTAVPDAPKHYFAVLDRRWGGTTPQVGLDLAAAPEAVAALEAARVSGDLVVTDAHVLLPDRNLPAARRQTSVALVAPIYRSTTATRRFVGWVHLALHGRDFLETTLRDASQGLAGISLTATGTGGRTARLGTVALRDDDGSAVVRTARLAVGRQAWQLRLRSGSSAATLFGIDVHLDEIALVTGVAVSILLALLVYGLAGGRARARAQVAAVTAELRHTERSARQQAALLHAVLHGVEDGIAVADADGSLVMLNPSAQATLAVPATAGPDERQQHYGLYRVDGVTPYPAEQLPLRRALEGTACTDEFVIRNAARPDGVRVRVSAQPLDLGPDRRGALAVARDVTALRACEADLAAFAGLAAQDLQAPLATLVGYLDLAEDDLAEIRTLGRQPRGVTTALGHLARVRTGADRMRRLIDDLLTYAAARDATLQLGDVDLNALVSDVFPAVLRPERTNPPHVVVRPLPTVRADGALLRRLLTHLLGNAVTYTPPDEAPRIAVRARPVPGEDNWVRIEIADHGIGIPSGQHARIFRGSPGAGLGLAICHRIVERHGGTIGAVDNPGGGTLVWFTLPMSTGARSADAEAPDLVGVRS